MTIHAKGGPSKINYSEGRGEGDTITFWSLEKSS
jgi:hypothetical protein